MSEEAIQDSGSQEAVAEAPVSFLESLPEDLRNEPSLRTFTDPGALAKSYVNAQRMIGADKVAKPGQSWTDDQYNDWYAAVGRPDSADAYDANFGEDADSEQTARFRQVAWEAGLQPRQLSKIVDFFNEAGAEAQTATQTRTEEAVFAAEQELRKEFGQAFEQRMGLAQSAARTLLGNEGMEMFENVQLADGRMLGDHPDVVRMFANLAEQIGEDNLVGEPTELIMTPEEASRQIAEMTRRDGPYFDKMHPEHDTYVAEVLRLREFM
jgi:hypothetical protein